MGKKKNTPLLKEGTVRQFMKLADLKSLSDGFITESADYDESLEEQDDFAPAVVPGDEDMPADMDDEMGMAPEGEDADVSLTAEEAGTIIALGDKLQAAGAGDEGEQLGDEDELPLDEPPLEGGEDDLALENVEVVDEDAIVKETLNRVAARLTKMSREERLVESIARRVEARMYRRR